VDAIGGGGGGLLAFELRLDCREGGGKDSLLLLL
jgi:hypothetical protein